MQKLTLRNNLFQIIKLFKSREIVELLEKPNLTGTELLRFIIDSKASYDRDSNDSDKVKVFQQFNLENIYSTDYYSRLVTFVSSKGNGQIHRTEFLKSIDLATFYSEHKTLIATYNIVNNLLLSDVDFFDQTQSFSIPVAQNNGNLLIEIIDEANVGLDKFLSIIKDLNKLIETVYLLYDKVENEEFQDNPVINMVDNGSDISLSIKLPKKAANLIAQIIREFWDVIINNKTFRNNQKLKTIENSISVMGKINEAKENGIIEPEMAEVLKKGVFENTKEIILKNALTKEIVIETKEYSNRQMLLDQTKIYQLESGKQNEKENTTPNTQ